MVMRDSHEEDSSNLSKYMYLRGAFGLLDAVVHGAEFKLTIHVFPVETLMEELIKGLERTGV